MCRCINRKEYVSMLHIFLMETMVIYASRIIYLNILLDPYWKVSLGFLVTLRHLIMVWAARV